MAFLDGRIPYWQGRPSDGKLAFPSGGQDHVDRYIFHVGFCGSTLLARLLDQPDKVLVLREPRSLTDLATYQARLQREGLEDVSLASTGATIRALLRQPWQAGEKVVVKPSNWANNLLPEFCLAPIRPIFLTMDRRAFVRAILRGGSNRIRFAARAAVHLSNSRDSEAMLVHKALEQPTEDETRLLTLAGLLFEFQLARFRAAADIGGWPAAHWLSLEELRSDLGKAVTTAAAALDIPLPASFEQGLHGHAKQPEIPFSPEGEAEADAAIEAAHGRQVDRVLNWIDEHSFQPR
jgi:hypothetical protein